MLGPRCTLEFLIHGVGADRNSSKFGAWAAPSAQTKITKCGGLRPPPPHVGRVCGDAGAAQAPAVAQAGPTTMSNTVVPGAPEVLVQISTKPYDLGHTAH